jgi:hypothetical protein
LSVFFDDFDGGQAIAAGVSGGFSGFTTTESAQGFAGLGTGANVVAGNVLHNPTGNSSENIPSEKTTLMLSGLPAHTGIDLKFLLAIVDTWDGNIGDYFFVDIDGTQHFAETFTNFSALSQSYVAPPGVLIQSGSDLGFEIYDDSLYNMGLDAARFGSIPHSGATLQIDFHAGGFTWTRPANESWAIDNVEVILLGVPEPATMWLLATILGGWLLLTRHRL